MTPVEHRTIDPVKDSDARARENIRAIAEAAGANVGDAGGGVLLGGVSAEARSLLAIMVDAVRAREKRPVGRFGIQKWALPVALKRVKGHEAEIVKEAQAVYENGVRGIRDFVRQHGGDADKDGTFSVDYENGVASELPVGHPHAGAPQGVLVLTWTPHDVEAP